MAAAINNNLGTLLADTYAAFPSLNATGLDGSYQYTKIATCAIPVIGTDLAGSQYRMCQVFSSDIPIDVQFFSTALTAGALSIGLWLPNGVHVSSAAEHLFATSIDCTSAVTNVNERYTNKGTTTVGQRIWQLLGLASDPELVYDLVYVSTTGATAAGTLGLVYKYTR